ncbi:hypothetical protein [Myxococcus qinghaiensis]|uniref:hypothetical protein n=1 Tax=Myxococcus qinghaiensis TaxID=2906758 RepID=UPI0020A81F09|nr:hypothetical protein [Myxococcus qinghaiensis]
MFGFRSEQGPRLLTTGFAMLVSPGQQYEIPHEHAGRDRCVISRFDEAAFEELVGNPPRGAPRRYFARSVLPPSAHVEALRHLAEQQLTAAARWAALHGGHTPSRDDPSRLDTSTAPAYLFTRRFVSRPLPQPTEKRPIDV